LTGSQWKGLAWLGCGAALAAALAGGLPKLAKRVPLSWEKKLDTAIGPSLGVPCPPSTELGLLMSRLYPLDDGDRALPVEVNLVRNGEVNAFATLGGRISVNAGLLEQAGSPDELAGVIAHELEHVRRRHIAESLMNRLLMGGALRLLLSGGAGPELARQLLNLGFSRAQERQADAGAYERLRRARLSAGGLQAFFTRLSAGGMLPPLLSDHPAGAERAQLAAAYAGGPVEPVLDAAQWKRLKNACR
jgi:hypothetical protein